MLESCNQEDFDEDTKPASWECLQNLKDVAGRHDSFWHQISMGSTATGTPLSINPPHWELELVEERRVQVSKPSGPVQAKTWRQRKYMDSHLSQACVAEEVREAEAGNLADSEVLICGALQQRFWGFAWRWRWCVLSEEKLCIYRDEACWREAPGEPFDIIEVADIVAVNECSFNGPQTFRCMTEYGSTLATFRGGDGELWEEAAAVHLWVDMVNSAARETRLADVSARHCAMSGLIWHQELQEAQLST
mmetsp:Transcript_30291/g.54941  ORF Transcript_30291/g.54941 Transcript_30291/m.54941 type:complete len:249 (+) Transcript_30291:212-958(+)